MKAIQIQINFKEYFFLNNIKWIGVIIKIVSLCVLYVCIIEKWCERLENLGEVVEGIKTFKVRLLNIFAGIPQFSLIFFPILMLDMNITWSSWIVHV